MNKIEVNNLLDFYAPLLTERQRTICDYYFREDYSLMEIAEMEGISRAAVHDTVKRCMAELESYEEKLHCYAGCKQRMRLYEKIREQANEEIGRLLDQCIDTEIE
jgi:predicted DNA-binding protein YlxM (UPF0122 family)